MAHDESEDLFDDDEFDDDESESDESPASARGAWTSVGRYLTAERADSIAKYLEDEAIDARVEPEGRATSELHRVRVLFEELDEAVEALESRLADTLPEGVKDSAYGGALGRVKRRRAAARLRSELETALDADDVDAAIAALWMLVDADPGDRAALARLVDLLIEREAKGDLELARLRLDQVMRHDGVAAVAIEMAAVAMAEGGLDEAEAWLNEAETSGADVAGVAFERCNLAFAIGVPRGLKQAASDFRRACDVPDGNWIQIALLLGAAGEGQAASRMLGATLRDGRDIPEADWARAAALKLVIEGVDRESRDELAELLGKEEAGTFEKDAAHWLRDMRAEWKQAVQRAKAEKKSRRERRRSLDDED